MRTALAALFCTIVAFLVPAKASACGGLFCGGGGPQAVNQTAERIVFSKNDDGTVTAIVQILYAGPTDRFGWVLPVPGIPDVDVSSDVVFSALQNATNPTFQMNTTTEGDCNSGGGGGGGFGGGCADGAAFDAPSNNLSVSFNNEVESPVDVVDSGSVGPYDYVVLQIDDRGGNGVQEALDWLESNNYQATNVGADLLQPYVDEGYNLLAMRLQKSQESGAIRPLKLTYDSEHPMIPIKLTAVAATDDMGVLVWVLGESRSVPLNYKLLELNDTLIDWFQPQATYNGVVGLAADEASGQGFVTEYAAPRSQLVVRVFGSRQQAAWDEIIEGDWSERRGSLIDEVITEFGANSQYDGLPEAIDQSFPGASSSQKAQILECGSCAFDRREPPPDFSVDTFIQAVDDFVVGPVRRTQELFDEAQYITRMYTNLSPQEMTLDPSFGFNPDLGAVDNQHVVQRVIECDSSVSPSNAPWRVEVPSGFVVRGEGNSWPVSIANSDMPATLTVQRVGEDGDPEVVRDNIPTVRRELDQSNQAFPSPDGGGGCSSVSRSADRWFAMIVALLIAQQWRRRRSRYLSG